MGRKQDFSQSTIYHIRVIETKMVAYVGSTTNFKQRCATHKSNCKIGLTLPIYKYIRDNGGFDLFEIIPVAFLQLNDVVELRIEEQKEMDKYTDKLNALKAYISKQERIEQMKEYNKHFRQENQEYFKQYREENQEKIKEQRRQYKQDNKAKRNQYNKTLITCECGCVITIGCKSKHLKSTKHQT
jgi:recombinational DNA repair protein (RecF pathway)